MHSPPVRGSYCGAVSIPHAVFESQLRGSRGLEMQRRVPGSPVAQPGLGG